MKEITSQQQRVLNCIQIYINKTGFPPTRANICRELGFKSPNSAETHLRALEKKGFISIESGTSRGISIIGNNENQFSNGDEYPVIGLVAAGSPTLGVHSGWMTNQGPIGGYLRDPAPRRSGSTRARPEALSSAQPRHGAWSPSYVTASVLNPRFLASAAILSNLRNCASVFSMSSMSSPMFITCVRSALTGASFECWRVRLPARLAVPTASWCTSRTT